ncbi:nucleotide disphospho-sugar-binding domain-containing protein [Gordonia sp. CPCC 206044]|uniref:glycosyltransferase n=1 Tax=Gordonia sp. CPCC 206044 TaxID=3140793 RepID=UPI003AF366B5
MTATDDIAQPEPGPRAARGGEHTAIVLYGSRGDIQPGICLALEMQRRAQRVTLLAPPNLVDLATAAGVKCVNGVGLDEHRAWSSAEATAAEKSRDPLARIRFALATIRAGFAALDDDLIAAFLAPDGPLADVDAIVAAPLCQDRGRTIAERLAIPLVVLRYGPLSENGVVGPIPGLCSWWPAAWKRLSWRAVDRLTWMATGWNENAFRRRIGLQRERGPLPRRLRRSDALQIQAFDAVLFPGLTSEWGHLKPVTGFLDLPPESRAALDESNTDSADLVEWLADGDPPVFITFGSMSRRDRNAVISILRAAVRRAGLRCLVAGTATIGVDSDDRGVYGVAAVDHSFVLPRCAAAVHHGGAGTTAAVLRAGLPMLICAVTADQPVWAHAVAASGAAVATRVSFVNERTVDALLHSTLMPQIRQAAESLAEGMVASDAAVAAAADLVETRLRRRAAAACATER